jgi:hypothetical protein
MFGQFPQTLIAGSVLTIVAGFGWYGGRVTSSWFLGHVDIGLKWHFNEDLQESWTLSHMKLIREQKGFDAAAAKQQGFQAGVTAIPSNPFPPSKPSSPLEPLLQFPKLPRVVLVGIMMPDNEEMAARRAAFRELYAPWKAMVHLRFIICRPSPSVAAEPDVVTIDTPENVNKGKTYEWFKWAHNFTSGQYDACVFSSHLMPKTFRFF